MHTRTHIHSFLTQTDKVVLFWKTWSSMQLFSSPSLSENTKILDCIHAFLFLFLFFSFCQRDYCFLPYTRFVWIGLKNLCEPAKILKRSVKISLSALPSEERKKSQISLHNNNNVVVVLPFFLLVFVVVIFHFLSPPLFEEWRKRAGGSPEKKTYKVRGVPAGGIWPPGRCVDTHTSLF